MTSCCEVCGRDSGGVAFRLVEDRGRTVCMKCLDAPLGTISCANCGRYIDAAAHPNRLCSAICEAEISVPLEETAAAIRAFGVAAVIDPLGLRGFWKPPGQ